MTQPNQVQKSLWLPQPRRQCFERFTAAIDQWWPKHHSRSGQQSSTLTLEPKVGGYFFEVTEEGERFEFGQVTHWDVDEHIALNWFLGSGPDRPSKVEIRFSDHNQGTQIEVTHRGVEELEELWWTRVAIFTKAWTSILEAFDKT